MWKLWNKLFGCDYVLLENTVDVRIARIWFRRDGVPMVSPYSWRIFPLNKPGHWKVTPLTAGAATLLEQTEEI